MKQKLDVRNEIFILRGKAYRDSFRYPSPLFLPAEVLREGGLVLFFLLLLTIFAYAETGTASWYSVASCKREGTWQKYGGKMANGEVFNDENYTVASWDYSFGTRLRVTNLHNKRYVEVRVTDRGPTKRLYRMGRIIDLSKGAFRKIASLERGVVEVRVEVINE